MTAETVENPIPEIQFDLESPELEILEMPDPELTERAKPSPPPRPPIADSAPVTAEDKKPGPKKPETKKPNLKKPTVPDFSEWHTFISDVVIRWAARGFIAANLRGIEQEWMSPEDREALYLDDEELESIARPFASMASRSKIASKYGRSIIDSADSIEAAVIMAMWQSRVRRIARKYKQAIRSTEENGSESRGEEVATEESNRVVSLGSRIAGASYN